MSGFSIFDMTPPSLTFLLRSYRRQRPLRAGDPCNERRRDRETLCSRSEVLCAARALKPGSPGSRSPLDSTGFPTRVVAAEGAPGYRAPLQLRQQPRHNRDGWISGDRMALDELQESFGRAVRAYGADLSRYAYRPCR